MARPREFDRDEALDAAIGVFREHGFEGTSTEMLVRAMGIGRQSLYDTFGDKWQLYRASLQRYAFAETQAHASALRNEARAIDGIRAMIERVIAEARQACLGVNSVCEFGAGRRDLNEIHDAAESALHTAIVRRIGEAQAQGDVAPDLDPEQAAAFLSANLAGLRIAARGGMKTERLKDIGQMALRALR